MSDDMPDPEALGTGKKKSPRPTPDIERLKAMARQRGHVTLDQIKSVLPVEQMSAEDVGNAMALLEAAGVDVQIDPEFLCSRADMKSDERWRVQQNRSSKANLVANRSTPMRSPTSNSRLVAGAAPAAGRWTNRTPVTFTIAIVVAIVCAFLIYVSYWR